MAPVVVNERASQFVLAFPLSDLHVLPTSRPQPSVLVQTIDLSAHTSRHSVMLLFSPTADDAEFDAMSKRVWARPSVWRDRRTIIYELFFEQTGMVFGRGVSHDATRELAEELGVPRDRFTLVLIGQDGRMIFQSQESLPIGHLVRALDGTTARHEMRS